MKIDNSNIRPNPEEGAVAAHPETTTGQWARGADGIWRLGDHSIALEADDPTSWYVRDGRGDRVASGRVPHPGHVRSGWRTFAGELDYEFARRGEAITVDGLEPWHEQAEVLALDAYEEQFAEEARRRAEEMSRLPGRIAGERLAAQAEGVEWLVPGVLAPGQGTMLAGREKLGKGTLALYLIGRLERGEKTVFGAGPGYPVEAVVLTEEPRESMDEKLELFGVKRARIVEAHDLAGLDWNAKVDRLVGAALVEGRGLIFVDNASRAAGIEDEAGNRDGARRRDSPRGLPNPRHRAAD